MDKESAQERLDELLIRAEKVRAYGDLPDDGLSNEELIKQAAYLMGQSLRIKLDMIKIIYQFKEENKWLKT